ncbi:hypothetical protein Hanom_Chr13g01234531 [Helianthus anomalus]
MCKGKILELVVCSKVFGKNMYVWYMSCDCEPCGSSVSNQLCCLKIVLGYVLQPCLSLCCESRVTLCLSDVYLIVLCIWYGSCDFCICCGVEKKFFALFKLSLSSSHSLFRVMLSRVRYIVLVTNCVILCLTRSCLAVSYSLGSWNICDVSLVFSSCVRGVSGCVFCQNSVGYHRCLRVL